MCLEADNTEVCLTSLCLFSPITSLPSLNSRWCVRALNKRAALLHKKRSLTVPMHAARCVCHTADHLSCGTAYPQAPVSSIGGACDGRVSLLHEPSSHGSTGSCRRAAASTSPAHAPSAAATALSISELTLDLAPERVKEQCTLVVEAPQPPLRSLGRTPVCPADRAAAALPPVAPGDDPEARRRRLVLARLLLSRGKAAEALAHLEAGGLGVQNAWRDRRAMRTRRACVGAAWPRWATTQRRARRARAWVLGIQVEGAKTFGCKPQVLLVGSRRAFTSMCMLTSLPA